MATDYYQTLGVSRTASPEEIKKAYRTLAHQHHPDKAGGDEAKFKEINTAYQVLGNPEKRQQYDQFGQSFDQAGGGPGGAGGFSWDDFARASGAGGAQQGAEYDFGNLGDIFGDLFGFGQASGGNRRRGASRGSDIQAALKVSFREAAFGVEKLIQLYKQATCSRCQGTGADPGAKIETCKTCRGAGQVEQVQRTILGAFRTVGVCPTCRGEGKTASRKCRECGGDGRTRQQESIKVKVPAGISDGEAIRLAGKGEAGPRGTGSGDLYLTIRVESDSLFRREGDDVLTEVEVSLAQAALGARLEVETLDGAVALKVPAGTQPGKVFRLREKGVPHLQRRGRGDHLVTVLVKIPTHLSGKERGLLEQLAALWGQDVGGGGIFS